MGQFDFLINQGLVSQQQLKAALAAVSTGVISLSTSSPYLTLTPPSGQGNVSIGLALPPNSGVSQLLQGPGISLSPTTGLGAVTVGATYQTTGGNVNAGTQTPCVTVSSGPITNINCALGNIFLAAITGPTLVTVTNPADGQTFNIGTLQAGGGSPTSIAWPNNFYWPNGTIGQLTQIAGAIDLFVVTYIQSWNAFLCTAINSFAL